jgi:deoxycytidine triphosphate deaminase
MIYYRLKENSTSAYGTCGSNYQGQKRLKLAKFFVEKK